MLRTVKSCGPGTRCWCQVSRRFWRPDRAREAFNPRGDGDKKELVAGESTKDPVKTIAQGRPDDPGYTCGSYRVLFVARGPWVRRAPGLPCALVMSRDKVFASTRGAHRLRELCRVRLGRRQAFPVQDLREIHRSRPFRPRRFALTLQERRRVAVVY